MSTCVFSAYLPCAIAFTDIRKQEEVLQESYMMIPDSKSRLEKVILELVGILVSSFAILQAGVL